MKFVPLVALIAIFLASLLRGAAIKRNTGDRAWAFGSARGAQRLAGIGFGVSSLVLAVAAGWLAIGDDAATVTSLVGAGLAVCGATIVIVAQVQMGRAWRVGVREGDAPLFVRRGLFGFSRNPIFVGMILIGLSIAIVSGFWWTWLAWLGFLVACRTQVRIEEAHLSASFGAAYHDYCRAVPRWFGLRSQHVAS